MDTLYRISPLEKKNVEYFVDVYEVLPNGQHRGFDVTETWRWGFGFREMDDPVYEYELQQVKCDPSAGWGCDLDDLINVRVNFSDGFTDVEKVEIEALLCGEQEDDSGRWGSAWVEDGEHNWQIEDRCVYILGPVKIDLVDANGYGDTAVIEENIKAEE